MLDDVSRMRIDAGDASLAVTVRGAGTPALVFLHYFGGSRRAWDAVIDELAANHRCVAVDLRGHGDSSAPAGGYTVGDGARDVEAVIDAIGLKTDGYVLVGHSMGGKIAMALASRRPPGLRALVLIAPSPPTPEPIPDARRSELLTHFGDLRTAEETADRNVATKLDTTRRAGVIGDSLRTAHAAWRGWLEVGSREDISALVPEIDVPTLVVAGGVDHTIPAPLLREALLPLLVSGQLRMIAAVAHLMPVEAPAMVAQLIRLQIEKTAAPCER